MLSEVADLTALALAQDQDRIIRQAINRQLGRSDWELSELKGRTHCVQAGDHRGYYLDGKHLVTFEPCDMRYDERSAKVTFTMQYRW